MLKHPFDLLVQKPEQTMRLAEAALLFAWDHAREMQPATYLRKLDALGERVGAQGAQSAAEQIAALRRVLVEEEKFRGNEEDYHDPRNSLLHEVLDRKLGLPISLSVIWLDVAEQLGWPFVGLGLPGHFVIKRVMAADEIIVDPFHRGRVLDRFDCELLLERVTGRSVALEDADFQPASKRDIAARMLHNLLPLFLKAENWTSAVSVVRRLLALQPDDEALAETLEQLRNRVRELN